MKINGKWYFNETIPEFENGDSIEYDIAFTSNGKSYMCINCYNTPGPVDGVTMYYYVKKAGILDTEGDVTYDLGWADDAYRTIDFGAAYQEVSDEFYTWLTANAVQLSKPIPMTHPKGIKLLTKGHKLSKDIEVVPTFSTAPETVKITLHSSDSSTGTVYYTAVENGQYTHKGMHVDDTEDVIIYPIKNTILLCKGDGNDFQADGGEMPIIVSFSGYYNEDTDDLFETLYAYQATADGSLTLYVG